jgi:hypothetical protein
MPCNSRTALPERSTSQPDSSSDILQEFLHADELHIMPIDLSETGRLNLFRLFAGLFDEESPEEHKSRTFAKLAVSWTLSGFLPGSWQRRNFISEVIWDLCNCFDIIVQERGSFTQVDECILRDTKEKLHTIPDRLNFVEMTCEDLFQVCVAAFIPAGYLTSRDIGNFMPHMKWPLTREEVGRHFSNAEFDSSRGVGVSLQKCLNFHYKDTFPWWVPRAPRAAKAAKARTAEAARTARAAKVVKAEKVAKATRAARAAKAEKAEKQLRQRRQRVQRQCWHDRDRAFR